MTFALGAESNCLPACVLCKFVSVYLQMEYQLVALLNIAAAKMAAIPSTETRG